MSGDSDDSDEDDFLDAYEAAENPGSAPDVMDVSLPEILDDIDSDSSHPDIDNVGAIELMNSVLRRGSVLFTDGRMLTACPGYSKPAACGMYPLPHPATGDAIMVCTGPLVMRDTKIRLLGPNKEYYTVKRPCSNCPLHPDRINKPPEYVRDDGETGSSGWLEG